MTFARILVAPTLLLALLVARPASAQVAPLPPPAPLPPSAPLPPPAPVASAPIVNGSHTCLVGEHTGIEDADARTSVDLICAELAAHGAPPGEYEVRFGKLGSRVLVTLHERATSEERRVLLQGLDEVPIAAGRLVGALAERKTVQQTQNVDNVVSADSHKPKVKSGTGAGYAGLIAMMAAGNEPGLSAGVELGGGFRSGRTMFNGRFRAGGIGSGERKPGFVNLDANARYYPSDADASGFFGGGFGLTYFTVDRDSGSGFGAHIEGGVELLRSSAMSPTLSLRADLPFYTLKHSKHSSSSEYMVPISLNFGFAFR